ncbi:hypothetical protein ACFQ0D_33850, partial [Micromonospora zhanjiangensis]
AADAAATAERHAAATDRTAEQQHHAAAAEAHQNLRGWQNVDPGSPETPRTGEFRPDDLPDHLRSRYDALHDPHAREQFARMHSQIGNEQHLAAALDGMEKKAHAQGSTLEEALADRHEQAQAKHAARQEETPPPPDVIREIDAQLNAISDVRAWIDAYAERHPEVRGIDSWRQDLNDEVRPLQKERLGQGRPSVQLARDHGNTVQGVEGEVELAERTADVQEVGRKVSLTGPDGKLYESDVDVVADGGRKWLDAKNYNQFGMGSRTFEKLSDQLRRQLIIAALGGEFHVDGHPPQLEWHFTRGVDAQVAAALEGTRARHPVTGVELPHHVKIVGERLGPPGEGARTADPAAPGAPEHSGGAPGTP